jgi:hypothetical protein
MKTLAGLREKIRKPNDRTESDQLPTFLDVAVDSLTHMPAKSGIDSIKNIKLAEKLVDLPEPLQIEDAEFDRMADAVEKNPYGYLSWAHGHMTIKIQEWSRNEKP